MSGPVSRKISATLLAAFCALLLLIFTGCGGNATSSVGSGGGAGSGSGSGSGSGGSGSGGGGSIGGGGGSGSGGSGQSGATYLYVANQGPDNYYFTQSKTPESISIFKVDPSTSQLTRVGGVGDETKWRADDVFTAGQWLLTANSSSNITELKIDPATGNLTGQKELSTGELIAVTPNGKFAVIAEGGNLSSFSVSQSDGSLTKVSSTAATCGPVGGNSQWDASGHYFVLNNCSGTVVSVDPQTGAIKANATNATGLATATQVGFDASGAHYIAVARQDQGGQVMIYNFDSTSLSLTPAGPGPTLADGVVFAIAGDYLYSRNKTGHVYKLGGSPFAVTDTGITFDPITGWTQPFIVDTASNTAYIVSPQDNQVVSLRIGNDGGLTRAGTGDTGTAPWVMAVAHF